MATKKQFQVEINTHIRQVTAQTQQAAVRLVIKQLIRDGLLKKQPPTNNDGWWEGVKCTQVF